MNGQRSAEIVECGVAFLDLHWHRGALFRRALPGVGIAAVVAGVVLCFVEGCHPAERSAWQIVPAAGDVELALEMP